MGICRNFQILNLGEKRGAYLRHAHSGTLAALRTVVAAEPPRWIPVYLHVHAFVHTRTGEDRQRRSLVRSHVDSRVAGCRVSRTTRLQISRARARCVPSALHCRKQIRPDRLRSRIVLRATDDGSTDRRPSNLERESRIHCDRRSNAVDKVGTRSSALKYTLPLSILQQLDRWSYLES